MPEEKVTPLAGQDVVQMKGSDTPLAGSAGLPTQVAGKPTTVSAVAEATGGIGAGNLVQPDIDRELFLFESDETPLMSLMLNAKKVDVTSPEVLHFMVDERRSIIHTKAKLTASNSNQAVLSVEPTDAQLLKSNMTLLLPDVDGYDEKGQNKTMGKPLMLIVLGRDAATNNPIVKACNGPRTSPTDEVCTMPDIPAGSEMIILSTALCETQKEVDPDTVVPNNRLIYLQKRGMTTIVSDYFDKNKKMIDFTQTLIAEHQIRTFKKDCNRSLLVGVKSKFKVDNGKMGMQYVYTSEGLRWQIMKEFNRPSGRWTYEQFVALAKMYYTGEDTPNKAILICGKNVLEQIQNIDFKNHPEIKIEQATNEIGWAVTRLKTVFGNIDIKREPAFDASGLSNSAVLLDYGRLVRYVYKSETEFKDRIEGQEASSESTIVWDALAIKGTCHIWVNGDGTARTGVVSYTMHNKATAPDAPVAGQIYYLEVDCPAINANARAGQLWKYTSDQKWVEFDGMINAA